MNFSWMYANVSLDVYKSIPHRINLVLLIKSISILEICSDRNRAVTRREIGYLTVRNSSISGSTVLRRSRTIISWFKWIRNSLGMVDVDSNRTIITYIIFFFICLRLKHPKQSKRKQLRKDTCRC